MAGKSKKTSYFLVLRIAIFVEYPGKLCELLTTLQSKLFKVVLTQTRITMIAIKVIELS